MWLEIELEVSGDEIRVGGRGSRGERPKARALDPEASLDAFHVFATKVGRAVRLGRPLDDELLDAARWFHEEIFRGDIRDVLSRLRESSEDRPVVVRLFTREPALSSVPFEALCRPDTAEGFLGTSHDVVLARGVSSPEPWAPREVWGAVRVLAIAPGSDERALAGLHAALSPSVDAGEVEWLDPISGPLVTPRHLFERLRRGRQPHVVHFLGHGGVEMSGRPVLRVADDDDGEEVWISAEAFARELSASFAEELRLVVLEACEGARPAAFGSAAEILAQAGADAVVAHLWPVKADVARTCSAEIYRALTGADRQSGDIGLAVAAARRTLLARSAEAFSPVLYLRASDSVIFDFRGRRVAKPVARKRARGLAPALQALLEKPFTMILGGLDEERDALRHELASFLAQHGKEPEKSVSLFTLTQRCVMLFGHEILHSLFQQSLLALPEPSPPLIRSLARLLPPGVHVTLLWRPFLEHAIAEAQPDRTIYAVQPSLVTSMARPRVVKRAKGTRVWKSEPSPPQRFDTENDIVVLRLYGGYSPGTTPILSQPVLTEDDHFGGIFGDGHPAWLDELLSRPRTQPGLLVGLSVFEWRHRMILRWVYDSGPAPAGSIALLPPATSTAEPQILDSGGGLPGHITALVEDPTELAAELDELEGGE